MNIWYRATALAAAVCTAVTLSACGGGSGEGTPHSPVAGSPSTAATPTPVVTAPATAPVAPTPAPSTAAAPSRAAVNPLTGGRPSDNKVVAVKIGDTAGGRPQTGIDKANIVYIEQVEGGLERLLAVYNTTLPTVVEPVRSTRAGDPEILAEYGPIIYVASGGASNPMAVLERSNLNADVAGRGGPGFVRDPSRPEPYNLRANLRQIAERFKGVKARDIGLTWSRTIPNTPVGNGARVRTTVGTTPEAFNYDAKLGRYVRLINGAVQHTRDGHVIATPNVIVQYCKVTVYTKDRDVLGNPNYYSHTVGTGHVVVFRGGKAITGTWVRPRATDGTKLVDRHGKPIPIAPGGAWFVLVANGTALNK